MTCAEFLARVRNLHPVVRIPCLCTEACGRYWELRDLTWWGRVALWRTTVAGQTGTVWVRLSEAASVQARLDEERG